MNRVLEDSIKRGDSAAVRRYLAEGGDVNARDRYGQTALMLAAHHGHHEIVELLIAANAELDHTAKYHLSALMLAVVAGHVEIARILAKAGADLHICGGGAPGFAGKTAYELAAERGFDALAQELLPK